MGHILNSKEKIKLLLSEHSLFCTVSQAGNLSKEQHVI